MSTVILSEIAEVNIDAACWMPARKLAGAAMAAASNSRLIVMPPDVAATAVVAPFCALSAWAASLVSTGVGGNSTAGALADGVPSLWPTLLAAEGERLVWIAEKARGGGVSKLSNGSLGSVTNLDLIA